MHLQQFFFYNLFFLFCFLYFVFDICIMWFLRSSKTWLSQRFEADMNCFYLNTFHSISTFLYFYMITNFDSCYHHCYFHFIFIIISSFSMPLTFFILVLSFQSHHQLQDALDTYGHVLVLPGGLL